MADGNGKNDKKHGYGVRKLAAIAMLTALSLAVFVIEAQFPPLFVPGAKPGLANIFSLFALIVYGPAEAAVIVVCRALLSAFTVGSPSAIIYSLSAGIVSVALSALLVKTAISKISVVAVSVASAVLHNTVQNLVFCAVTATTDVLVYLPYLAIIGAVCGAFVGIAVHLLVGHLPLKLLSEISKGDTK